MIPRIKSVTPLPDYCLSVSFDDGRRVRYDVKEDFFRWCGGIGGNSVSSRYHFRVFSAL